MTLVRSAYGDHLVVFLSFSSSRSFDARRHILTHIVPCLKMSSGDNSNRANSENAFEGNSLSSSTPRGRKTPDFSWKNSSRWESASFMTMMPRGAPNQRAAKKMLRQSP